MKKQQKLTDARKIAHSVLSKSSAVSHVFSDGSRDSAYFLQASDLLTNAFSKEEFFSLVFSHKWAINEFRAIAPDSRKGTEQLSLQYLSENGFITPAKYKVMQHKGVSFALNNIQERVKLLKQLVFKLNCTGDAQAWVNAFYSPANTLGLGPHWDVGDAYIYQVSGSKKWHLCPEKQVKVPSQSRFDDNTYRVDQANAKSVWLNEGDLLFLPVGVPHWCETEQDESLHLTIAMNEISGMDIIWQVLNDNRNREAVLGYGEASDDGVTDESRIKALRLAVTELLSEGQLLAAKDKIKKERAVEATLKYSNAFIDADR